MSGHTRGLLSFLTVLLFLVIAFGLCFMKLMESISSPGSKKWAMVTMFALTGGVVGYLLNKKCPSLQVKSTPPLRACAGQFLSCGFMVLLRKSIL